MENQKTHYFTYKNKSEISRTGPIEIGNNNPSIILFHPKLYSTKNSVNESHTKYDRNINKVGQRKIPSTIEELAVNTSNPPTPSTQPGAIGCWQHYLFKH